MISPEDLKKVPINFVNGVIPIFSPNRRLCIFFFCLGLFSLSLSLCSPAAAAPDGEPYLLRLGGGIQSVFPEFGYSAILNLNRTSALQGIFVYNDYTLIYGGKYIHRFWRRPTHNFYAYGLLGHFSFFTYNWDFVSSPGLIAGVGLEFTTSDFIANLKYNIEIGYSTVGSPWAPADTTIVYGCGIHFYIF